LLYIFNQAPLFSVKWFTVNDREKIRVFLSWHKMLTFFPLKKKSCLCMPTHACPHRATPMSGTPLLFVRTHDLPMPFTVHLTSRIPLVLQYQTGFHGLTAVCQFNYWSWHLAKSLQRHITCHNWYNSNWPTAAIIMKLPWPKKSSTCKL
jgi:hypothetical protein